MTGLAAMWSECEKYARPLAVLSFLLHKSTITKPPHRYILLRPGHEFLGPVTDILIWRTNYFHILRPTLQGIFNKNKLYFWKIFFLGLCKPKYLNVFLPGLRRLWCPWNKNTYIVTFLKVFKKTASEEYSDTAEDKRTDPALSVGPFDWAEVGAARNGHMTQSFSN